MIFINNFPFYSQIEQTDCGATCIKIILKHYRKNCDLSFLRELTKVSRAGVSLSDIKLAFDELHFNTTAFKTQIDNLEIVNLPCILHWEQEHFVVLYKITKNYFFLADPKFGKLKLNKEEFSKFWISSTNEEGFGLQVIPDNEFQDLSLPFKENYTQDAFNFIKSTLNKQGSKILLTFILISISTIISYIFPQTIKDLFDNSVSSKSINILWSVFYFQLFLYSSQIVVNIIQNLISVHFSTQVSIMMLSNLLNKIVKLPISFFENRLFSDILQKIEEQSKIEQFFTQQLISTFFSVCLIIALCIKLYTYNYILVIIFLIISLLSFFWVVIFHKKRKMIDYYAFKLNSDNKNLLVEMITGMVTVKINNAHNIKIQEWHEIQTKIYKNKVKSLILESYQNYAITSLRQIFTLSVTFICAYWVLKSVITIGEMVSIGYVVGIISGPLEKIFIFIRSFQDSKLVYDRSQEIYNHNDENLNLIKGSDRNIENDIKYDNVSFKYYGSNQPYVLKNINISILQKKITAIVGDSGSGKSTFLKLLLSFYPPSSGTIKIGNNILFDINHDWWREKCGVVTQETYVFSGTIAENISMKGNSWNEDQLIKACKIANILEYVDSLPLGFNTKIGNSGNDLSGGQKQRILIARAVYKDPDFIFLDEATSALDAENEKIIHDNLQEFFKGKTVLIIAHRLSTVKKADQIIVLKNGEIVEQGNHQSLVDRKANYYNLVKNQLELGN